MKLPSLEPESSASANSAIPAYLIVFAAALPRDSCGARNFLHLGAVQNFDRGAFSAFASSATGGARLKTANSAIPAYEVISKSEE